MATPQSTKWSALGRPTPVEDVLQNQRLDGVETGRQQCQRENDRDGPPLGVSQREGSREPGGLVAAIRLAEPLIRRVNGRGGRIRFRGHSRGGRRLCKGAARPSATNPEPYGSIGLFHVDYLRSMHPSSP